MDNQSAQNKKAWEYRTYEFWLKKFGTPEERAKTILENPLAELKKHKAFFTHIKGKRIANLCGSNGRKAVPLALLGAEVTVFDISEENKRYALELARFAKTKIDYVVTDVYDINLQLYSNTFDMLYLEGGILHYFNDLERFMSILHSLLIEGGQLILSDYHPVKQCIVEEGDGYQFQATYFDKGQRRDDIAYKSFFDEEEQHEFPELLLSYHTLSDIINATIKNGFTIKRFDEHRGWNNENIPWEFTIVASK